MDKKRQLDLILNELIKKRKKENESKAYAEQGIKKDIEKFHEPVTKVIKDDQERSIERDQKLFDYMQDTLTNLQHIESDHQEQLKMIDEARPGLFTLRTDEGLDEEYLKSRGWSLPSKILTNKETLSQTIEAVNHYNRILGGMKKGKMADKLKLDDQIEHNRNYVKVLRNLLTGNQLYNPTLRGKGNLDVLTDELIKEPTNKIIKSLIKHTLDQLIKNKQIDNSYLKRFRDIYNV